MYVVVSAGYYFDHFTNTDAYWTKDIKKAKVFHNYEDARFLIDDLRTRYNRIAVTNRID